MINHVVIVQILGQIIDSVEVIIAELELGLDDEDCWKSSLHRRHVIGTTPWPAGSEYPSNFGVLFIIY